MDKIDVKLNLLFLEYQRYISRAHTIFTSFFEISMGILFGVFTIVLALVEIEFIPWNKFYFILTLFITCFILGIILIIAAFSLYNTRSHRARITLEIKLLGKIL